MELEFTIIGSQDQARADGIMRVLKETMMVLSFSVLLPVVKLLIVLLGLAETAGWVYLGLWAVNSYQQRHNGAVFFWPALATVGIYFQLTLWHYFWLRIAHTSDFGRVLAEWFCSSLRYPIARPPHPWE